MGRYSCGSGSVGEQERKCLMHKACGFAAVTLFNSLMTEMHVYPLRVALGPSVDYVFAWCGDMLGTTCNGPYFGGVARLAVDLRARCSAGSGLSLGLDAHPLLYHGGALMFLTLGVAAELD